MAVLCMQLQQQHACMRTSGHTVHTHAAAQASWQHTHFADSTTACRATCPHPRTPRSYSGFFYEGGSSGSPQQRPWFLSFTFAVASCVIVSGCLAERTRLLVYPAYTVLVASLLHPLLVHWVWVNNSWLNSVSACRVLDFAGGLPVHALGERAARRARR